MAVAGAIVEPLRSPKCPVFHKAWWSLSRERWVSGCAWFAPWRRAKQKVGAGYSLLSDLLFPRGGVLRQALWALLPSHLQLHLEFIKAEWSWSLREAVSQYLICVLGTCLPPDLSGLRVTYSEGKVKRKWKVNGCVAMGNGKFIFVGQGCKSFQTEGVKNYNHKNS